MYRKKRHQNSALSIPSQYDSKIRNPKSASWVCAKIFTFPPIAIGAQKGQGVAPLVKFNSINPAILDTHNY